VETLPHWLFNYTLQAGTWVGLALLPAQRRFSRAYLAVVLGRPPRLVEVWRHFFAFTELLLLRLRASHGASVRCELAPAGRAAFEAAVAAEPPALFGTFHFGGSDLLGFLLAARARRVSIVRQQVGNSDDTRLLGRQFGDHVSFLWINDPARLVFALKAALEAGESLALQCDRLEFSARTAAFEFLGARRLFPITIYHLAVLFDRPVVFCVAVPESPGDALRIHASPLFTPDPAAGREANLARAREHFQGVLREFEVLVRQYPFLWFNFLPLNPEEPSAAPAPPHAGNPAGPAPDKA
jgi:predicted LPLAT superfamily acyltransferase